MRPPTHDNPNAIPRNGTEVPWVDLDELLPQRRPGNSSAPPDTRSGTEHRRTGSTTA